MSKSNSPAADDRNAERKQQARDGRIGRQGAEAHRREEEPTHSPFAWRRATPPGTLRVVGSLPRVHNRLAILLWTAITLVMLCLTVPGVGWWPLGYVCLVPWLVCVTCGAKARFVYFSSYLLGLGFYLINVYWMYPVTEPGYFALAAFFGLQFPLAAWPIRHMYQKRGISVAIIAPIVWAGVEFLRCIGPLGFPMILLGHSQYRVLTMIQISDIFGAYGVSFVLAMVNGLLADFLIQPIVIHRAEKSVRLPLGTMTTLFVLIGTIIYGVAQSSTRHLIDGPNVAMIQHDLSMYTVDNFRASEREMFESFHQLAKASLEKKPDLIVLPETAVGGQINEEFITSGPDALQELLQRFYPQGWNIEDLQGLQREAKRTRSAFQKIADENQTSIVLGATAIEWKPTTIPARVDRYNSAYLLRPGEARPVARYDKRHVVLFGEYIPFRFTYPSIYNWLNSLTPWGKGGRHFSLSIGESFSTFEFPLANNSKKTFRAAAPICYEEIMPYITREFARGNDPGKKDIDLLVPISNDGWFAHSTELEQHLVAGVFRAVENRVAVARSVNTGASAMIYPNGKIHSRVELSKEQVANLDPIEKGLVALRPLVDELEAAGSDQNAFNAVRRKISPLVKQEIVPAYQKLGPGYNLFGSRLDRLQSAQSLSPSTHERALKLFKFHVEEELSAVRRWRKRPDTAPGFVVDQAKLDGRLTFYTRGGDWFAATLLGLTAVILLDWFQLRIRRNRIAPPATEGDAT